MCGERKKETYAGLELRRAVLLDEGNQARHPQVLHLLVMSQRVDIPAARVHVLAGLVHLRLDNLDLVVQLDPRGGDKNAVLVGVANTSASQKKVGGPVILEGQIGDAPSHGAGRHRLLQRGKRGEGGRKVVGGDRGGGGRGEGRKSGGGRTEDKRRGANHVGNGHGGTRDMLLKSQNPSAKVNTKAE